MRRLVSMVSCPTALFTSSTLKISIYEVLSTLAIEKTQLTERRGVISGPFGIAQYIETGDGSDTYFFDSFTFCTLCLHATTNKQLFKSRWKTVIQEICFDDEAFLWFGDFSFAWGLHLNQSYYHADCRRTRCLGSTRTPQGLQSIPGIPINHSQIFCTHFRGITHEN